MNIITDIELLKHTCEKTINNEEDAEARQNSFKEIKEQMLEVLNSQENLLGLAAPQIGINKRVIALKFDDKIKFYIDPVVTKKDNYTIIPESCSSLPGKEILILRPAEIKVVYTTDEFKYEDNKMLDNAAFLFDQLYNLLDGVTPDEFGLVSDPSTCGSLKDLSEEDFKELIEVYKTFIKTKTETFNSSISEDAELQNSYKQLQFAEKVLNGEATLVDQEGWEVQKQYIKHQNKMKRASRAKTFREFVGSRRHH